MLAICLIALFLAPPEAKELFISAEQALRSNDLAKAEREFSAFLKLQPNHLAALGNLGVVYSRMGRFNQAIVTYSQALKLAPQSADLHLNLGLAWLKQDDHKAALKSFEQAASIRTNHLQTKELLATAQLFTGNVDEAIAALQALPSSQSVQYLLAVAYLKQNRTTEARQMMDSLFAALRPAQAHLLAGRAYYESAFFEEADKELKKASDLDPNLSGVWRELGKNYVSLRHSDEAVTSLREAIRRDPGDIEATYFLGALLVQNGDAKAGVPLLERAREARPSFWGPWYYLGKAALAESDSASASRLLQRAAELNPNEPSTYYQLSRALKALGRDADSRAALKNYSDLRAKSQMKSENSLVAR